MYVRHACKISASVMFHWRLRHRPVAPAHSPMLNLRLAYAGGSAPAAQYSSPALQQAAAGRPAETTPAQAGDKAKQDPSRPEGSDKLSPEATRELVKDMNRALQQINTSLEFTQDEESGRTVVKVIDRETRETLRQFPSEEALALSRSLDKLQGVLLRQTA